MISIVLASVLALTPPAPVVTHDNQRPAGTLQDGTLVLHLRAATGVWQPEGPQGPGLEIDAFGEGTGPLMAPAPLIRVPEGTSIIATIKNDLATTLTVHGLCEHTGDPATAACAPIAIPAHNERSIGFRAGRVGTYSWWASASGLPLQGRFGRDTQMSGAFVVDPAAGAIEADRVFVVTEWTSLTPAQLMQALAADDPFVAAIAFRPKFTTLINGRSWPETERLTYRVGDLVKWRIVNASPEAHPLHLHGFYFDVDSLGTGTVDRPFDRDSKPHVVTQLVRPGQTMALTWMPERAGNWLFHCHILEHVSPDRRLTASHAGHDGHDAHSGGHEPAGMAGMVLGVTVLERSYKTMSAGDGDPGCDIDGLETPTPRKLTLTMRSETKPNAASPTYGFVLNEAAGEHAAPLTVPGPTLVLRQEEPVEITLVNQLPEATAVHWHGIELDSYYDGVHGFSGLGAQTTPMIEPGGTFTVKFTPPRTGTFIYHTHVHDERQLTAGLYGALLVREPSAPAYDAETDHPLVIGRNGVGPAPVAVLNGSTAPSFSWRAGRTHRLRLVNITRHDIVSVSLMSPSGPVQWTPLTKDGAAVPKTTATARPAVQTIAVGETYDFAYEAPAGRQSLWIEVKGPAGDWLVQGHAILK